MSDSGVCRKRPLAALAAAAAFVCVCLLAAAWAEEQEIAARFAQGPGTPAPVAAEDR